MKHRRSFKNSLLGYAMFSMKRIVINKVVSANYFAVVEKVKNVS